MDASKFIQNVKNLCAIKGVYPTVACIESGAGRNLIANVEKGVSPSVEKVQALAKYLGVTTSELLGEVPSPIDMDAPAFRFLSAYLKLSPAARERVLAKLFEEMQK